MTVQNLLEKCEEAYRKDAFEKLIKLCDKVFKKDPNNQIATGYKAISYCFLNQPKKALEILKKAVKLYPNNYYYKNIASMAYYNMEEYEKSLKCCDEGLKIKDYDWLYENKIKALLKLDRTEEAMECYEKAPLYLEILYLLLEAEKYSEAFKCCLEEYPDEYKSIIDKIKQKDSSEVGDYYISWIYKIKSKTDARFCPDCGGELIPIVWGYPDEELLKKHAEGKIFLGGCSLPLIPPNYHCKKCGKQFDLGFEGLEIECEDDKLYGYIKYKISRLLRLLKHKSIVLIKSRNTLKKELKSFDDEEFNAFIEHLIELDYLCKPREGYVKLVGYDDFLCAKEYLDEGKFAAPVWLAFPQGRGACKDYAMINPHHTKEYEDLFPMPKYLQFTLSEDSSKERPVLAYFWNSDSRPKYPNTAKTAKVNEFITLNDENEFRPDSQHFKSVEIEVLRSKTMYFKKCNIKADLGTLKKLEYSSDEEEIWDIYRYSVMLNACYFKIMQDNDLKRKLLETGNAALIYLSDDKENLFGRALMEIRDEIRRICKNEDLIDWEYTEYLKYKNLGDLIAEFN